MATHFTRKKTENGEIAAGVAGQHAATSRLPSGQSRDWLSGAILVLAVILVYSPLWWAGYIWDDDNHVTANPCIVGPLGLKEIWTTSAAQQFPLVLTTFWLEHALWGLAPLPYHLVNVLLHAACAVVLWQILRSLQVPGAWLGAALLGRPSRRGGIGGVDLRDEEHPVRFVLPAFDSFLHEMG